MHTLSACCSAHLARLPGSGPVAIFEALKNLEFAPVSGISGSCPDPPLEVPLKRQNKRCEHRANHKVNQHMNHPTNQQKTSKYKALRTYDNSRRTNQRTSKRTPRRTNKAQKKRPYSTSFHMGAVARPGGLVL